MKQDIVNASDAGKAAYCAHALSLSKKNVKANAASIKLQKEGTRKHDRLTQSVISEGASDAQDSRCYVASYAFGCDHTVTQSLRDWRDHRLLSVPGGYALVRVYYATSPAWVQLCRRHPRIARASKLMVMMIYRCISKGGE